jgi:hypothetical protein
MPKIERHLIGFGPWRIRDIGGQASTRWGGAVAGAACVRVASSPGLARVGMVVAAWPRPSAGAGLFAVAGTWRVLVFRVALQPPLRAGLLIWTCSHLFVGFRAHAHQPFCA